MAEDNSSHDSIEQINKRLDYLESISRETVARLYSIEMRLGIARRPDQPGAAHRPESDSRSIAGSGADAPIEPRPAEHSAWTPQIRQPQKDVAPQERVLGVPVPQGPPPAHTHASQVGDARQNAPTFGQARPKPRGDLEARIGGNWFNRIGIIAIAIGVAFFLKYAFDNQWIGPWGRVLTGVAIGFGFLIGGERMRPRYHNYAYGLTGGGVLILYLSIYAAHAFFSEPLIGQLPAFVCMLMVTATASMLAARYNALPIAFLGLIGGFLTPILLSTGVDNQAGLFTYVTLLDVGVLALAYSKQWRSLNHSAFVATALMFAAWTLEWYAQEKLWTTIFFLTLFFIIFSALAVLYNVVNRRPTTWADLSLVFANGILYFGSSYMLLEEKYRGALGLFAVLMSAFYFALGYFTRDRDREDQLLIHTFLGLGFLFAVLAVPIQFNQHWVTMAWATEGVVMTWVGLRAKDQTSRYAALAVFVIAMSHWVVVDVNDFAYRAGETFVPLLNSRALSCAALVAALSAAAILYKRDGSEVEEEERSMFMGLYTLGANALTVTLLSLDANDYFAQLKERAHEQAGGRNNFRASDQWRQIDEAHQLTLSALWTVYGTAALIVGRMRRVKPLRLAAGLLLAITVVKVIVVDLKYYDARWHAPVFNQTFAAFALLIVALSACIRLYSRAEGVDEQERWAIIPLMVAVANLLAIIALSAEAYGYYAKNIEAVGAAATDLRDRQLAQQLSLSVIWTVYGGAMLAAGIARRNRMLRMMALGLLGLTIVKVFLIDLSSLEKIYRIVSFIVLGAILLAVSFLYQRYRQRMSGSADEPGAEAPAGKAPVNEAPMNTE
jgi:uncharacterized membrane protein